MPTFVFTGPEPRVFHAFGVLEPGASVDAKDNPDPVWFAPAKPKKPAPADNTSKEQ